MIEIKTRWKNFTLSVAVAAGMTGFGAFAQTNNYAQNNNSSRVTVRQAQQQLKNDGDYTGNIDGICGPETQHAIREYQRGNNLKVNGMLDRQTINKLGIRNTSYANRNNTGEAYRYANASNSVAGQPNGYAYGANNSPRATNAPNAKEFGMTNGSGNGAYNNTYRNTSMTSTSTVEAAQRQLEQKGLYNGKTDGRMGSETQNAIREYQRNNNLKVTGQLDQNTINRLGISNTASNRQR